jgi:general secretion pathway protein J
MPARGFTLLEIMVAMSLLALMAGVLMGSLRLTGRSLEGGENKAEATANMRLAAEFLRAELEAAHPLRMRKMNEFPVLFSGERNELRFAAAIPQRVTGAGVHYYRLAAGSDGDRTPLVLERIVPDANALDMPEFRDAERSILADDVEEVRIGYLGRDAMSADAVQPTWRDRWDDRQRLPLMLRIEVRPRQGAPWPTLYVTPRLAPESGCRAWDVVAQRCQGA